MTMMHRYLNIRVLTADLIGWDGDNLVIGVRAHLKKRPKEKKGVETSEECRHD